MLEGFPNLFMISGPNGPSVFANLIRMAEHDVDWVAAVVTNMTRNGQSTVEPTKQAEDAWMDLVLSLAPRTLVSKANTWYLNANVKDKPQGLTIFTGGFLKYREYCAAQAQSGYRDFALERAAAEV